MKALKGAALALALWGVGEGTAWAGCSGATYSRLILLEQDTYVRELDNSNFVNATQLIMGESTTDEWRTYLKFDYSDAKDVILDLQDGNCLLSAELHGYVTDTVGTQREMVVSTVKDFNPSTIKWSTQPGSYGFVNSAILAPGWNSWQVWPSIEKWREVYEADTEYLVGHLMVHIKSPINSTSYGYLHSLETVGGNEMYIEVELQEP